MAGGSDHIPTHGRTSQRFYAERNVTDGKHIIHETNPGKGAVRCHCSRRGARRNLRGSHSGPARRKDRTDERYGVLGGNLTVGYVGPILGMVGKGTIRDELLRLLGVPDNDMIGKTGLVHDIQAGKAHPGGICRQPEY